MAKLIDLIVSGKSAFANDINAKTIYSTRLYMSGAISTCNTGGTWVSGMTNAAIRYNDNAAISSSNYHPFLSMKAYGGHVVNFGGLENTIGFYGYYNGRTANSYDWSFTVNSSTGKWTMSNSITSSAFITSGGANTQVVRGDGTLQTISSLSVSHASTAGNADTVDNKHASDFATSGHTHPYLPLAGGTMNANSTITLPNSSKIIHQTNTGSNYVTDCVWYLGTSAASEGYDAQIGWHNTGDSSGAIVLLPYKTTTAPWANSVGMYISKTNLKFNGKKIWREDNDGSGSGLDADTTDGLHVHSGRNNEANKIVRTDGSGYIQCGYINSSSGNEGNNSSPARVWGTNGSDNYMRTYLTSALSVKYSTSAGNADTLDSFHSNRFTFVYNSTNYNNSSSLTLNQMAADGNSNSHVGMIYAGTDNPVSSSGNWVHVWSQSWSRGSISSWCSQIALGVQQGTGMWYRTTSGALAGRAWNRVLDSANYTSYVNNYYWANVKISTSSNSATYPTFGSLAVINDSCNNSNDSLAYFQHRSNTDWTVKIDSGSYDYGLLIIGSQTGTNALIVTGASRFTNTIRIGNGYTALDGNYCEGIRIRAADNTWATIILGATADTGTNTYAWSIHRTSGNNFSISRNSSDGANGLLIDTSGRVGIGTTSPSERLSVNGWVGTIGNTGWYSITYGGGWYMTDSTWVRSYNGKGVVAGGFYHSSYGSANYLLTSNGGAWAVHTGRNNEANKIVRTDGSGYLQTGYINTNVSAEDTLSCSRLFFEYNNDGYIRKLTPARFRELITDSVYLPRLRMRNPSNGTSAQGGIPFPISLKGAGYPVYTDPEFASGNNSVHVYNNSGNGTVTISRISDNQGSSNSSGYILQISTTSGTASPGRGGFCQTITSRNNAVFAQIFRAKIPTGFSVVNAENAMGSGYSTHWLTDTAGTGKWEWYIRVTICGTGGSFSSGGHVYLSGSGAVTWYLSYCNLIDLTQGNYDGLRTRYSDYATSAGNAGTVTVNNSDSNSTYRMVWHSGNTLYGTGGIYCNPYTDYLYASSMQTSNWFRSTGNTGWYNESYSGGWYMTDSTWIRSYNGKGVVASGFYHSSYGSANYLLTSNGGAWAVHTGRNNEANKIVRTDGNGYIQAGWINTTSGDMGTTAATRVYCSDDGYIRYKSLNNFSSDVAGKLYWANVNVSTSSNSGTYPTFANMKSTGRVYLDEWIQFSGSSGLYWPNTNGAHLYANTTTSYAGLITQGSRGGYCGLQCGPGTTYMTVMSTDTHHGLFCENTGTWEFYYNRGNGGVGIRTSSITKNFNVSGQSYLSSNVWIGTTSGGEMLNVGGGIKTENYITFGTYGARFDSDIRNSWRTNIYGNTTNESRIKTVRTDANINNFSEIYGSGLTWATGDTQGYLGVSYSSGKAWIGGGNSNTLNWSTYLVTGNNIGSQSVSYASSSPAAANYGGQGDTTKIKIKINSATSWMLSFVVTIYQGYKSSKVMVSGYNYGSNYWYQPEAVLLGDSNGATSIPVYFGYDSAYNLWVGFDGGSYTGVSISDVTNGYTQISSYKDLFTISNVSSLSTLQRTITATNSVNYAVSAGNADTVDSQHFNWNNNKNDHTYLWAASSNGQAYLVHRASMSVNYANSAGSASSATIASTVTVNSSDANSTYRMVWHSGNTLYGTGGIYCNPSTDTLYASAFYESSDIRLKQNIKQVLTSNDIPQIKEFDWKNSGKHSYGLIAQELESMGYSELVDTKDDGYKSVNYTAALCLIIGKLQLKIKELEDKIKSSSI